MVQSCKELGVSGVGRARLDRRKAEPGPTTAARTGRQNHGARFGSREALQSISGLQSTQKRPRLASKTRAASQKPRETLCGYGRPEQLWSPPLGLGYVGKGINRTAGRAGERDEASSKGGAARYLYQNEKRRSEKESRRCLCETVPVGKSE